MVHYIAGLEHVILKRARFTKSASASDGCGERGETLESGEHGRERLAQGEPDLKKLLFHPLYISIIQVISIAT